MTALSISSAQYTLNPVMPVLTRPDGAVQVGWDPQRAVLVRPPNGLTTTTLAALLRSMQTPVDSATLQQQATRQGLSNPDDWAALVSALVGAGVAAPIAAPRTAAPSNGAARRSASVRIHGSGPLSDLLADSLRCSGARVRRTSQPHAVVTSAGTALVVLSDHLVAEPRTLRELHAEGIAHLPVRVRDGTGLVGPLVIPGVTSCLGCADLHRRDRDAAWPAVAAQLRDTIAHADRATVLATVGLALGQINRVIAALRGICNAHDSTPPPTLNTTLEFDVGAGSITARRWTRHPLCNC